MNDKNQKARVKHLTAGSVAIAVVFLSAYTWTNHHPSQAVAPSVDLAGGTVETSPPPRVTPLGRDMEHATASSLHGHTPSTRQEEKRSDPEPSPFVAKHHLKRLRTFVGKNDLDGFLTYLSDHDMDLNTQTDDESRTRLFELWFPFTDDIGMVDRLKKLIDAGAILDPPDHNTLSSLLFTGNTDMLIFMVTLRPSPTTPRSSP
ncbi:hypothetical protein [Desulfoluna spongiiphila]|uniref:Uncharacterized protein n=1 Tax=Desulfoluna spongiiphila TaxID=419481 RepID=A0A1G5H9W1_9BACT|nr:hypothetical protein [Desulfoluna spongiiphila]SCY60461.1 hypothetical protein SAMN05216233_11335 [Desulfoluna spongiiphila]